MKTLFLDTHDDLITISFVNGSEEFNKTIESEFSHATVFLPLLDEMLKEKSIKLKDFERIVVVNGPGSFTGVRIGLTVAKTIAYSLNIPIYTISSLNAYLISSNEAGICIIEDSKGFYIGEKQSSDELKEFYTNDLGKYENLAKIKNILNPIKIVNYFNDKKPLNVHSVIANYIKVIEALK